MGRAVDPLQQRPEQSPPFGQIIRRVEAWEVGQDPSDRFHATSINSALQETLALLLLTASRAPADRTKQVAGSGTVAT
jgi:hypothetical protein